ncbi:hypothetical protein RUM44_001872 [Polyplax serrata]|uniref:Uncharacterized protein n=1 Tax=Polyplax serrata TaxID=468196 RepID=A0ABR1ALA4_POLSC
MFGGNAKTHFQVLGRANNSTGYMMSPFGDDRWDLDDSEKLRKIYKKTDLMSPSTMNLQTHPKGVHHMSEPRPLPVPMAPQVPCQGSTGPNYYGYVQPDKSQGFLAQGEDPKAYQTVSAPLPPQVTQSQSQRFSYYKPDAHVFSYQPRRSQTVDSGYDASGYRTSHPSVKHHNGLNHDELKQKSRVQCGQMNISDHTSHSLPQIPNICGQCQHGQPPQTQDSYTTQKHWRSSPDVPVWIAGSVGYRPFGPAEPTPNPYYPPRNRNEYIPLN